MQETLLQETLNHDIFVNDHIIYEGTEFEVFDEDNQDDQNLASNN